MEQTTLIAVVAAEGMTYLWKLTLAPPRCNHCSVLFYIRLNSSYLDKDSKLVMSLTPEGRRKAYISTANRLVENMSRLDIYVRTPKSYLYYEKALKSIDEVVEFLA